MNTDLEKLGITDKYSYRRVDSPTDLAMVFKVDDEVYWFHYMTLSIHSMISKELSKKYRDEMKVWKKSWWNYWLVSRKNKY